MCGDMTILSAPCLRWPNGTQKNNRNRMDGCGTHTQTVTGRVAIRPKNMCEGKSMSNSEPNGTKRNLDEFTAENSHPNQEPSGTKMNVDDSTANQRFKLAQCLCPQRHCILACMGTGEDEALREQLQAALDSNYSSSPIAPMKPWCGLCAQRKRPGTLR